MSVCSAFSKWLARKGGENLSVLAPVLQTETGTWSLERVSRSYPGGSQNFSRGACIRFFRGCTNLNGEDLDGRMSMAHANFSPHNSHQERSRNPNKDMQFQVDWRVISPAGLGDMFRELLADFLGAPKKKERRRFWWNHNDVSVDAPYKKVLVGRRGKFLIRGIIYEMSSLMEDTRVNLSRVAAASTVGQAASNVGQAASNVGQAASQQFTGSGPSGAEDIRGRETGVVPVVEASEVIRSLGLGGIVPGLDKKLTAAPASVGKKRAQAKPSAVVEADSGFRADVRAKYGEKIHQKKMLAEARRAAFGAQDVLGSFRGGGLAARLRDSAGGREPRSWISRPGAAGLLRHFKERGLPQALLALQGSSPDMRLLLDQLGSFAFSPVATGPPPAALSMEAYSREQMERMWTGWGVSAKQVLLVVGGGQQGDAVLRAASENGCFVCRMDGAYDEQSLSETEHLMEENKGSAKSAGEELSVLPTSAASSATEDSSIVASKVEGPPLESDRRNQSLVDPIKESREDSLLAKFREGFLSVKDAVLVDDWVQKRRDREGGTVSPHFVATGMLELKKIIEDMNGVSYRGSTFVRDLKDQWNSSVPQAQK